MPEGRDTEILRRRRDAMATREAILEAATCRFATQGYESAGAREIAADAGVTAALVNRYFGSKEGLFAEVIERAFDIGPQLRGGRETLAEDLARVVLYGRGEAPDDRHRLSMLLLRSAAEPRAAVWLRRDLDRSLLPLIAGHIGGDDALGRAEVVVAQLTGFVLVHEVLRPEVLAHTHRDVLAALLTMSLAACIGCDPTDAPSAPVPEDTRPQHPRQGDFVKSK